MSRHRGRQFALLVLLLAAAAFGGAYRWIRAPTVPGASQRVVVEFPIGTPTRKIFRTLQGKGIVRQALPAEVYYRIFRRGAPLRSG